MDVPLTHGTVIRFGTCSLEVRATPGHTNGCLSYVTSDHTSVFTGDALLVRGAGRTDFQQGDSGQLYHSIHEQLFSLGDDCLVYPAHDYEGRTATSVGEDCSSNRCNSFAFNPLTAGTEALFIANNVARSPSVQGRMSTDNEVVMRR